MNEKKRWQIAVLFSVFIHLIVLIVFAWQINKWLPTAKPAVTQEDTPVFIDNSELENSDNDAGDDTVNDEASGKSGTPAQPDSDVVMPSNKKVSASEASTEDTDPEPAPPAKKHAIAYNNLNTSTHGLNLAELKEYPTIPKPIFTKDFEPPENLQASPHRIRVEVKYQIQPDGSVHAGIQTSSGEEDVDQAAIDAVSDWKYSPSNHPYPLIIYRTINWPPLQ